MSFYNSVFGTHPAADVLLSLLNLNREQVGRFRDCYLSGNAIAVYTRNGAGNRQCWHEETPEYGYVTCHHTVKMVMKKETIWVPTEDVDKYHKALSVFTTGGKQMVETGKTVEVPQYTCLSPDSNRCCCPGCIITHRLPQHPLYLRDEDDDYDCTYATIYFAFPEKFADDLKALSAGKEPVNPPQRWVEALNQLKGGLT